MYFPCRKLPHLNYRLVQRSFIKLHFRQLSNIEWTGYILIFHIGAIMICTQNTKAIELTIFSLVIKKKKAHRKNNYKWINFIQSNSLWTEHPA